MYDYLNGLRAYSFLIGVLVINGEKPADWPGIYSTTSWNPI